MNCGDLEYQYSVPGIMLCYDAAPMMWLQGRKMMVYSMDMSSFSDAADALSPQVRTRQYSRDRVLERFKLEMSYADVETAPAACLGMAARNTITP